MNYEKLAISIGFSYLNGGNLHWEDSYGNIKSYDSMDNKYLENCVAFVKRGIEELKSPYDTDINSDIKKKAKQMYNISLDDAKLKDAKKNISDILANKLNELQIYIKDRKVR